MSNLDLWDKVEKTDPKHTKSANVRGNKITAIAPQRQIKNATEQFGVYGIAWGFKSIKFDYALAESTGIVVFHGVFYFPKGEFPITSSISAYKDGARLKPDADFAKKVETDALTKGLSKLGFNADVFMGMYDDHKYVQMMQDEFKEVDPDLELIINNQEDSKWVTENWGGVIAKKWGDLTLELTTILNNSFNGVSQ
ncbi:MAG: hypothetical protein JKY81_05750 [Colwellia sp.]|nr:hypothetical protein [Colwellia sp.]